VYERVISAFPGMRKTPEKNFAIPEKNKTRNNTQFFLFVFGKGIMNK
jgi:hypothetical protein